MSNSQTLAQDFPGESGREKQPLFTREMKITLPVLLAGYVFSNLDQSLFSFAIPGIQKEFGSTLSEVGWILSASFALAALLTVVFGLFSDRYGRRITFVITLGASAFFVGLHSLMPTLLAIGLVRILGFGVSNGLVPIVLTYAAEMAPPRLRGAVIGVLSLGYPIGGMLAGLMSSYLLAEYGWRAIFMPAFLIVPAAIMLGKLLPRDRHAGRAQAAAVVPMDPWQVRLRALFSPERRRTSVASMISSFMFGGAYAGTYFYFPSFLHEARGLSPSEAAEVMGIALGIGSAGYITAALVGDFVMPRRDAAMVWMALGATALMAVVWVPTGTTGTLFFMSLMTFFFYGANGVFGAYLPEMFPAHLRATGVAVVGSLALYGGFSFFPPAIAHLVEARGWNVAFTISAIPLYLAAFALLFAERRPNGFAQDDLTFNADCDNG